MRMGEKGRKGNRQATGCSTEYYFASFGILKPVNSTNQKTVINED